MKEIHFTGWDIGGAHLKVASMSPDGELTYINQFATPLWQGLDCLGQVFPVAVKQLPQTPYRHAVTMTAELADIFANRQEGIDSLSRLCQQYLGDSLELYASNSGFQKVQNASFHQAEVASANWHASSQMVAATINSGLFIDIGSTTTDIIPFADKQVLNLGHDDQTRMQQDELVYTGAVRTSLMSLARRVPFAGQWQTVAAEHFATTADIYRILGLLDDEADLMPAADGGNKDIQASIRRLARMVGVDAEAFPDRNIWQQLAAFYAETQLQQLTTAVQRILSRLPRLEKLIVAAGTGRFMVKSLAARLQFDCIEFSELMACKPALADKCNVCAPAVALAQLNRLRNAA